MCATLIPVGNKLKGVYWADFCPIIGVFTRNTHSTHSTHACHHESGINMIEASISSAASQSQPQPKCIGNQYKYIILSNGVLPTRHAGGGGAA